VGILVVAVRNPLLPLLHPGTLSPAAGGVRPARRRGAGLVRLLALTIAGALAFRTFGYEAFNISSGSMMPTLLAGDEVLVSKFAYGLGHVLGRADLARLPARGDVVVFAPTPNPETDYIKRVIGLPGDRVQVTGGRLHLNGEPVPAERVGDFLDAPDGRRQRLPQLVETLPGEAPHPFLKQKEHAALDDTPIWTVPPGHVFVMGDNRDVSEDSRSMNAVGFVPLVSIVGRAEIRLYSLSDGVPWWAIWRWPEGLRPDRVLTRIR
jgi:signal peptidase I